MFYTNKENDEYLNFSAFALYMLGVKEIPKEISKELGSIYSKIREYEKKNKRSIGEMTISKDSVLGRYVVESNDSYIFDDINITYKKIVDAFNITVFEDNPISKDIYPLFKQQISGDLKSLSEKYDENLINYILNNNDFEYYLSIVSGKYEPKEYKVFENGDFVVKKLPRMVNEKKLIINEK